MFDRGAGDWCAASAVGHAKKRERDGLLLCIDLENIRRVNAKHADVVVETVATGRCSFVRLEVMGASTRPLHSWGSAGSSS